MPSSSDCSEFIGDADYVFLAKFDVNNLLAGVEQLADVTFRIYLNRSFHALVPRFSHQHSSTPRLWTFQNT